MYRCLNMSILKYHKPQNLKKIKSMQSKFKTLLFLLLAFTLSNCSSDDSVANQAPNSFNLIDVADGATDISLQPQLSWEAATDPDGDSVTYQVYLDTQNPPQTSIANNLNAKTFSVENEIQPEVDYYWKVIAKDSNGNATESDIASFTSRELTTAEAILGKWFFDSQAGQPPLPECKKSSFLKFTDDLFLQLTGYGENTNGDCVVENSNNGTYEVIGRYEIEITIDGSAEIWDIISRSETELVLETPSSRVTLIKE